MWVLFLKMRLNTKGVDPKEKLGANIPIVQYGKNLEGGSRMYKVWDPLI